MKYLYQVFGLSKQGYHQRIKRSNKLSDRNETILAMVREVRKTHPRAGTRKLMVYLGGELKRVNIKIGRNTLDTVLRDKQFACKENEAISYHHRFKTFLLQIAQYIERNRINT